MLCESLTGCLCGRREKVCGKKHWRKRERKRKKLICQGIIFWPLPLCLCLCHCASVLRLCPALRGCWLGPVNVVYNCHVTSFAPFLPTVFMSEHFQANVMSSLAVHCRRFSWLGTISLADYQILRPRAKHPPCLTKPLFHVVYTAILFTLAPHIVLKTCCLWPKQLDIKTSGPRHNNKLSSPRNGCSGHAPDRSICHPSKTHQGPDASFHSQTRLRQRSDWLVCPRDRVDRICHVDARVVVDAGCNTSSLFSHRPPVVQCQSRPAQLVLPE